ncbi:hypothetical protein Tsubulata_051237, partial [Turnera subulata]
LQDGREVAFKRLHEHNYKRVKQFFNEIKVLTGLKHKNLVSLYGCASSSSHKLLLVYEYIPNGTVADHLHGDGLQKNRVEKLVLQKKSCSTLYISSYEDNH